MILQTPPQAGAVVTKTMKWKRGLFRMWLVGAIGWIVAVGWLHFDQLSEFVVPVEPLPSQGAIFLPEAQYACWIVRHVDDDDFSRKLNGPELPSARTRCTDYRMEVPTLALSPPLILFTLGYALIGGTVTNWKRRLFRAWLVLSVTWIGFMLWITQVVPPAEGFWPFTLSIPIIILLLGYGLLWASKGFRSNG